MAKPIALSLRKPVTPEPDRDDTPKPLDPLQQRAIDAWNRNHPEPWDGTPPWDESETPTPLVARPQVSDLERRSDTGNAALFAELNAGRVHYIPLWKKWIVWTGTTWNIDHDDVRVVERAKNVARELIIRAADVNDHEAQKKDLSWAHQSFNISRLRALIDAAGGIDGIPIDHEALDTQPELLGVKNGVINLRTGDFGPGNPADLMTMQSPIRWDAEAECPRFEQAMAEWFPDEDLRQYVKTLVGQALVGNQNHHVFVIHHGGGSNGKGTFTRIITFMLGPYAVEPHMSLLMHSRNDEHATVRASLFRARLAVASETDKRRKLDEASVKNLTGGDRIRARRMREDEWSFTPSHSLWLQTNHLPQINGRDEGIWRRVRVVPWVRTFSREKTPTDGQLHLIEPDSETTPTEVRAPDPNLDQTLQAEAPGILKWMVEGAVEYLRNGLHEPQAVIAATLAYRDREDVFTQFAAEVGLTFDRKLSVEAAALNDRLEQWATDLGQQVNKGDFAEWMKERGGTHKRAVRDDGKKVTMWFGAGLADNRP